MTRISLRILCEGPTEGNFVTQVLSSHLKTFNIFVRPEVFSGVKTYDAVRRGIKNDLGRARAHEYVSTMFDLYGLPNYPGDPGGQGIRGAQRAERIETAMAVELPSPQFIPYIQVHEFEALVFVDLDQLPPAFPDGEADGAPAKLRHSIGALTPEEIDDGPATAPSKRLIRTIPAYKAQKPLVGPLIAGRIGLPRLRAACPHLNRWIHRLEQLAV